MKKLILMLAGGSLVFLMAGSVVACEFQFRLITPGGQIERVVPGEVESLKKGETYTLCVDFTADHRRCTVPPQETVFLLLEEKWKVSKEYLPLRLIRDGEWVGVSPVSWTKELRFTAAGDGSCTLEILRECPRGGYDESLVFMIAE